MQKILSNIFMTILLICSMSLISCEAIKAQNINSDSFAGIKSDPGIMGGPKMQKNPGENGNPEMNGRPDMNNNLETRGITNSDLMGKIISIDGNIITIEIIEQTENNKSSNSNKGKQDVKNNQNSDNNYSQNTLSINGLEINYTGTYRTIEVSDDVTISQESNIVSQNQNINSNSPMKISDLKKDQIIMAWYKENTDTVEKINLIGPL